MSELGSHKPRRRGLVGLPLRLIRSLLRRFGYDLAPYSKTIPQPETRIVWLERLRVDLAVDVGANEGQFVDQLRLKGYLGSIVSFEPLIEAFKVLTNRHDTDPFWQGVNCALGERPGEVVMHISGYSPSSSLLPMLETHVSALPESAIIGETQVSVARLETALASTKVKGERIFLKIDAQGFEAPVLRGAGSVLDRVVLMELELSLTPLYEGQILAAEMLMMISELGFTPIWVEPGFVNAEAQRLLQIDVLFARTNLLEPENLQS